MPFLLIPLLFAHVSALLDGIISKWTACTLLLLIYTNVLCAHTLFAGETFNLIKCFCLGKAVKWIFFLFSVWWSRFYSAKSTGRRAGTAPSLPISGLFPWEPGTTTDLWLSPGNLDLSRLLMLMADDLVEYTCNTRSLYMDLPGLFCTKTKIDDVYLVSWLGSYLNLSCYGCQYNLICLKV